MPGNTEVSQLTDPPPTAEPHEPPASPRHSPPCPPGDDPEERRWRKSLAESFREPAQLLQFLGLAAEEQAGAATAAARFSFFVPRGFASRMRRGDRRDPLLLQVLPAPEELLEVEGLLADPVGDLAAQIAPGALQKYSGRALLLATGVCAVNCRYCFRREFPYAEVPRGEEAWSPALERIAADPSIFEVILSGGDPLVLGDAALESLAARIASIPHVSRLRVHTRLPVVIPERVTAALTRWLRGTRLVPLVVVHVNHPAELDAACGAALEKLVDAGIPVLNQAVLLRGINDDLETLVDLCLRLGAHRVLPYYLHQLDPVRGAAHFRVEEKRGLALVEELRRRLPGHAVPRYVREEPGAPNKLEVRDAAG